MMSLLIFLFGLMAWSSLFLFGRSVEVDPQFAYYRNRSPESIAAEIGAHGYRTVRYILTADSNVDPRLISAFHQEQIGVWYLTFMNGTYSTKDLPTGWESWKMVTRADREGKPTGVDYTFLCLNNPDYRAWKKRQITSVLSRYPFGGIDLIEPHWPDYPGPESPTYGCFCPHCAAAFKRMFPEETALPDILHPDSPLSPQKNPALWRKWLQFRKASLTDFLNNLVNGKDGIRALAPHAKVCIWTLALAEPDGVRHVLEDNGEDAAEIARMVKPDLYGFQTHWPDWSRPDLPPTYVDGYKPFFDQVRSVAPGMLLLVQADIGSLPNMRRGGNWIAAFEQECRRLGIADTTLYEYFIGMDMYTVPPRIVAVRKRGGRIELVFTKRLDPVSASNLRNYTLSPGRIVHIRTDGNLALLRIAGVRPGAACTLTVQNIKDDPTRRLYHDKPATLLKRQTVRFSY